MAIRVTVLDMDTGEERVFVRNACGVICAAVMPKEGAADKYDGVATANVAERACPSARRGCWCAWRRTP